MGFDWSKALAGGGLSGTLKGDWIDSAFKGKEPNIMTKKIVDPLKQDVATPLSQYLQNEIGKGLPRYSDPTGMGDVSMFSDFLSMDPGEWYQKAVADPTIKEFQEKFLPEIREGYAGALRGSGRYGAEEAGMVELSEKLAQGRYAAEVEIPAKQFEMRSQIYTRDYNEWMASLPQNNPALSQALQFLSEGTSTGTTILSALDPGKKGWFWDLLDAAGQIAAAVA